MALAHVLKWAWVFHEAKTGEACTWDLDALAEGISARGWILTRCVIFCRCEWTANKESSLAEAWMISKRGWEMNKKAMCLRFLFVQPGVVSTCSVTGRISFVNSFAAVFRKGVLEFVWIF